MQINEIQDEIKSGKGISLLNNDTLKYIQKPIGKSIYNNKGRPKIDEENKAKYYDKVICKTCGKIFIRSNRNAHKKTKYHQIYLQMNDKLSKLLIDK